MGNPRELKIKDGLTDRANPCSSFFRLRGKSSVRAAKRGSKSKSSEDPLLSCWVPGTVQGNVPTWIGMDEILHHLRNHGMTIPLEQLQGGAGFSQAKISHLLPVVSLVLEPMLLGILGQTPLERG